MDKASNSVPSAFRRTQPGRADLIDALACYDDAGLEHFARLLGYEKQPGPAKKAVDGDKKTGSINKAGEPSGHVDTDSGRSRQIPRADFWYLKSHQQRDIDETTGEEPAWHANAEPLSHDESGPDHAYREPGKQPLTPWRRLWPFLRMVLGGTQSTIEPDLPKLVGQLVRGQALQRIPYLQRRTWSSECRLIFDVSHRLVPYWDDFGQLQSALERLRGKQGLQMDELDEPPQRCHLPRSGTPLLILSDLGQYDKNGSTKNGWRRFGRWLRARGIIPLVLTPTPSRLWDKSLSRLFIQVVWDHTSPLPGKVPRNSRIMGRQLGPDTDGVTNLLDLLAPAIRVEPSLLRAARYLLPADQADVGNEAELWQHPDVFPELTGFAFQDQAVDGYRENHRKIDIHCKEKMAQILVAHHAGLPPVVLATEMRYCAELGVAVSPKYEHHMQRVVKTLLKNPYHIGMGNWVGRSVERHHTAMWERGDPLITAAWVAIRQVAEQRGETLTPPIGVDLISAQWLMKGNTPRLLQLRQVADQLVIERLADASEPMKSSIGSPIASISAGDYLQWQIESPALAVPVTGSIDPANLPHAVNLPPSCGTILLQSDFELLSLTTQQRPKWASAMGCDRFGLYAEFNISGVTQRMRWICPGTFMMGSPETESERRDNETRHQVTLTQGYWLADTACTQELWEAVMEENPSDFKGAERPVEQVSWKDVQRFVERINVLDAELGLRLPTEAEWEYACRAGTETPFAFGEQITTVQANYDGNHPYNDGPKGPYRKETIKVKALAEGINTWGLQQMHGNVWEWCADWYGDYPEGEVVDPVGPPGGEDRVLRGGGWIFYGRYARSAQRSLYTPVYRYDYIGFRLARGQKSR